MTNAKPERHKWLTDHDKLVFCCVKLNVKKEACLQIANAIGIDYKTQFLPRHKDYESKVSGNKSRRGAGAKEDETINFFQNKTAEEMLKTFRGLLKKYDLNYEEIVKNQFSKRDRVTGYSNFSWTHALLLLPYMASRFGITDKNERKYLSGIIGSNANGFDAIFYGFNFLNGKGRDDNVTAEMRNFFEKYNGKEDSEVILTVKNIYPKLDEAKLTIRRHVDELSAVEGIVAEANILKRSRNSKLAEECKERDNHTCQACGFRLFVNGRYIIDCHHTKPLSSNNEPIVTAATELVSLCPRCHRIAHTVNPPMDVGEIRTIVTSIP